MERLPARPFGKKNCNCYSATTLTSKRDEKKDEDKKHQKINVDKDKDKSYTLKTF